VHTDMLKGNLTHLVAVDPKEIAEAMVRWNRDSEYQRLAMIEPANQHSVKKFIEWAEKSQEKDPPEFYYFSIRKLGDDRLLGSCGLGGDFFPQGEAFVGIGIGERQDWNKGYGTDAMKVILRYAFEELNLRRVSLTVMENNRRGICSYEKAGFMVEGKLRRSILREGQRWNDVLMGILREEWLAKANQVV
jgi:RimJ/RimL family protein N-acetyltransferase